MSPSILERHTPFHETNWRVFETETKHGVSEESIKKHLGASSTRSENEKPAGVFSPIEKCGYCSGMHDSSNCKYYLYVESILEKKGAPKVASTEECSTEECRICHDKHDTFDCDRTDLMFPSYADDQENVDTPIQECDFCFGNHDPADCKLQYLISEPDNEDSEVATKIECPICRDEHLTYGCPCWSSVPQNSYVSPFYFILCSRCGVEISNTLKCLDCQMEVKGYVCPRVCCSCGDRMSSDCCRFGEHISKMKGYITPPLHVIMEDIRDTADQ